MAGDQPTATRRTGNLTGPSNSKRVSPSLQVSGSVYFSVCTSTPSARKADTAQSTALAISGEPVTRPPTSSVRRRRFSSSGEGPITWGRIFDAASAHDASVAEHAAAPWPAAGLANGSVFAAGNCPEKAGAPKHARKKAANKANRMIYTSGKIPTVANEVGVRIIAHRGVPCSEGQVTLWW